MNYRIIFLFSAALALLCLFTPFVRMEVGPMGHRFYGPTVPDVYIYGGAITGKDTGFWAIGFAVMFQLIFILLFAVLSIVTFFLENRAAVIVILFFQCALLALFPLWLSMYVNGVINNSDAADLTIHYQYGMWMYYTLIALNIVGLITTFRLKQLK